MKTRTINLSKIIYSPLNQKYKISFTTSDQLNFFNIYFDNVIAKQIAMASEGIVSAQQGHYDLFISLLDSLKMKVYNITISKNKNNLISKIQLTNSKKDKVQIFGNVSDGLILAFKTFSKINIQTTLLSDKSSDNVENYKIKENSKLKVKFLEVALTDSIKKENYESAAFLRDRIKELKSK